MNGWSFCGMADSSSALLCDLSEGQPLTWNFESPISDQHASMLRSTSLLWLIPLVQRGGLFCLLVYYLTLRKPYELKGQVLSFAFVEETTGKLPCFKVIGSLQKCWRRVLELVFLTLLLCHAAFLCFMELDVINTQTLKNKLEEKSHPVVAPALGSGVFKEKFVL